MNKQTKVVRCFHSCPLFKTSMEGMYCGHPWFDTMEPYDCFIIDHENSRDRVPDGCPLHAEPLTITVSLS